MNAKLLAGSIGVLLAVSVYAAPQTPLGNDTFAIVTPEWVADHCQDKDIRILDVRNDVHDYLKGHVPNAVYLSESTLRAPMNGLPVRYLSPAITAELFERAGVNDNTRIVVYSGGDDGVLGATMVAYSLERLGHANVMIMDGGFEEFQKTEKTTQEYPKTQSGKVTTRDERSIFATLNDVRSSLGDPDTVIVDARPSQAFRGDVKTWMRNGHIPGSVNIDWRTIMHPQNTHKFRDREAIQRAFEDRGVTPDKEIIVSCGTSREATIEYVYLKHVLNYPNVRLYEGAWTEWCSHPELPMETGEGKPTASQDKDVEEQPVQVAQKDEE